MYPESWHSNTHNSKLTPSLYVSYVCVCYRWELTIVFYMTMFLLYIWISSSAYLSSGLCEILRMLDTVLAPCYKYYIVSVSQPCWMSQLCATSFIQILYCHYVIIRTWFMLKSLCFWEAGFHHFLIHFIWYIVLPIVSAALFVYSSGYNKGGCHLLF